MALELVYTSATRGLRPGTSGFCTVAMTRGFPPALVPRLEALGGYRPGPSGDGPVARCFWRVETAAGIAHVLAKVGPASPDHTARTNKIASYLVLGPDELVPAGPAWLLAQAGLLRDSWSGDPQWIERPAAVPAGAAPAPRPCHAWAAAAGDAGWAGVLASAFLRDQSRPAHVIVREGTDPLPLVDDALGLLPDWARWRASFSTYFLQPVAGTPCAWRFCLEGTPAADAARQSKGLVIDLARAPGAAPDSRFARRARTGIDEDARTPRPGSATTRKPASASAAAHEDTEIGLEPDAGAPSAGGQVAPRRRPGPEEPAVDGGRSPIRPVVVGIVAAVLTLLLLLVLILLTVKRAPEPEAVPAAPATAAPATTTPAPTAPAPTAPAPDAGPAVGPAPDAAKTRPDPTPEPAPEPAPQLPPEPRPEAAPSGAAAPAGIEPATEPSGTEPTAPEPATPDPVAGAGAPATTAVPAATAGVAEPVRWMVRLDGGSESGGSLRRRGRMDVPADATGARLVARTLPDGSLASTEPGGERAEFGDGRRVAVRVESRQLVVEATAPAGDADAGASMQAALDRVMVELVDRSGNVLGRAQLRAPVRTPIELSGRRDPPKAMELEVGPGPVAVEIIGAPSVSAPAGTVVAAGERRSIPVAGRVFLSVDRSGAPSTVRIAATVRSDAELGEARAALSARIGELNRVISACEALQAYAEGGARPADLDERRAIVEGALPAGTGTTAPGAGPAAKAAPEGPSERATIGELASRVLPGAQAEQLRVTAALRQENEARRNAAQPRRVRLWTQDGVVALDAPVALPRRERQP